MKITKEKQEIVKSVQKNKTKKHHKKNWFLFDKSSIKNLYLFLIKSSLKGWYLSTIMLLIAFPFGISILFCSFMKLNNNTSYFLGISYTYLINAVIMSFYICFSFLVYFKFTDLESRISTLGINKFNYLLSIIFVALTYIFVNDIISFATFNLFLFINKINILNIYKWPTLFFIVFSLLATFMLIPLFLLMISYLRSIKISVLLFELITTTIIFITYILLFIYFSFLLKYKIDFISKNLLSYRSMVSYFVAIPILLMFSLLFILLFNKKFSFKQ